MTFEKITINAMKSAFPAIASAAISSISDQTWICQRFGNLWLADEPGNATSPAAEPAMARWATGRHFFRPFRAPSLNALPRACPGLQPSAALRVLGEAFGVRTHFNYAGSFSSLPR